MHMSKPYFYMYPDEVPLIMLQEIAFSLDHCVHSEASLIPMYRPLITYRELKEAWSHWGELRLSITNYYILDHVKV